MTSIFTENFNLNAKNNFSSPKAEDSQHKIERDNAWNKILSELEKVEDDALQSFIAQAKMPQNVLSESDDSSNDLNSAQNLVVQTKIAKIQAKTQLQMSKESSENVSKQEKMSFLGKVVSYSNQTQYFDGTNDIKFRYKYLLDKMDQNLANQEIQSEIQIINSRGDILIKYKQNDSVDLENPFAEFILNKEVLQEILQDKGEPDNYSIKVIPQNAVGVSYMMTSKVDSVELNTDEEPNINLENNDQIEVKDIVSVQESSQVQPRSSTIETGHEGDSY